MRKSVCFALAAFMMATSFGYCEEAVKAEKTVKVDRIFTNGNVYTVDDYLPWATAIAIKDGKIVYVGNDAEAKKLEGPVTDLQGKFVMPGLIDSHVHVGLGCHALNVTTGVFIEGSSKTEVINAIKKYIDSNKDAKDFKFYINAADLHDELITRDELDKLCPDKPLHIVEAEQHSRWMNSLQMKLIGLDDYRPDIAKGLSYADRDADGRINGRIYEFCATGKNLPSFSKEQYVKGMDKIIEYWNKWGVVAAFDAGFVCKPESEDNFYSVIKDKVNNGELRQYMDLCEYIWDPAAVEGAIERIQAKSKKYDTGSTHTRICKIMMDGTINGRTAAFTENYLDTPTNGGLCVEGPQLTQLILDLNEKGIDLHVHVVGDRAITNVLDSVERAQKKLGGPLKILVTCAHIEYLTPENLGRFAKLGVIANFTPHWFGGNSVVSYEAAAKAIGPERAKHMYRANTIWNTGALVCFSSDDVTIDNMKTWNPYMGMECGMTRQDNDLTATIDQDFSKCPFYPSEEEKLTLSQMIRGFTLNAAKQMRLDDRLGSITVGKEASFLVFKDNLFDIDKYQIHKQLPESVYIRGELINTKK